MGLTTAQISPSNQLLLRLEKINVMKWLLDLENKDIEISENELQERIDKIACKNYTYLTMLNFIFSQCPQEVHSDIKEILITKDRASYRSKMKGFKDRFETDSVYGEFEHFLLIKIVEEAVHGVSEKELKNDDIMKDRIFENKRKYYVLLFNILSEELDQIHKFETTEIIHNLPLLTLWIDKNKFKPIETLTADDCEIIAGLYYGFNLDDFFALNLTSSFRSYEAINKIIEELPSKFHVNNISQLIFRLFLLKPFLWCNPSHEAIVEAISGIHNVL